MLGINRYTHLPCHHRYSVVKRWTENGRLNTILRCRWCDLWTRKTMALDQDSHSKTVKMHTQKFVEEANTDDK